MIFSKPMLHKIYRHHLNSLKKTCLEYKSTSIALSLIAKKVGARVGHPGFNQPIPTDQIKTFKEASVLRDSISWNIKDQDMNAARQLINSQIESANVIEKDEVISSLGPYLELVRSSGMSVTPTDIYNKNLNNKLAPLGKLTRKCIDVVEYQQEILYATYSKLLAGIERVSILGFPDHPNRGDAAIYVAERLLLKRIGVQVVYISSEKLFNRETMFETLGEKNTSAIMLHGKFEKKNF